MRPSSEARAGFTLIEMMLVLTMVSLLLVMAVPSWRHLQTEAVINGAHLREKVNKTELSKIVATKLAKKAQEKKITKIYFDRGIYRYHGRVKVFAETLRENGMEFSLWKTFKIKKLTIF